MQDHALTLSPKLYIHLAKAAGVGVASLRALPCIGFWTPAAVKRCIFTKAVGVGGAVWLVVLKFLWRPSCSLPSRLQVEQADHFWSDPLTMVSKYQSCVKFLHL